MGTCHLVSFSDMSIFCTKGDLRGEEPGSAGWTLLMQSAGIFQAFLPQAQFQCEQGRGKGEHSVFFATI